MNLPALHKMYFIGIGGIGMSALARYFNGKGVKIYGYDKTETSFTGELIKEGMQIHFEENIDWIPKDVDLVVYTPAIPADHKELVYYKSNNYQIWKRSDLLEKVTEHMFTIAVAGTHGKTTTSTMVAHILRSSGNDCSAFLGGVSVNYHTNFLPGKNKVVVVEADEFDRSFLKLHPDIAVITSVDADHLDIYHTKEELQKSYLQFSELVKQNGTLVVKNNLPINSKLTISNKIIYDTDSDNVDAYSSNLNLKGEYFEFDYSGKLGNIKNILLTIPGKHNVENAVAAVTVALLVNIEKGKIKEALSGFKGVKRRFEYIVRTNKHIFIDDYAHHPHEIESFLSAVKEIYPEKKLTCIFQPHLYTRTRDFANEFAKSLSLSDELILLPIYPARELPIKGVDSEMILNKVEMKNKRVCSTNELLKIIKDEQPELIVTVGAGDIDQLVEPIRKILSE
jgi:UDP-N-acetylmuramate--alanine ligase